MGDVLKLESQLPLPAVQFDDPIATVFEFWKALLGHHRAQLGPKRRAVIRRSLAMGYTVDDLRLAIVGCKASDFHQGENKGHQEYDDIELICRDETHIDRFIRIGERRMREAIEKEKQKEIEAATPRTGIPPDVRARLDKILANCKSRAR